MAQLARMRTLDEAYSELKQLDPHTALSKYALRQMALSGVIPVVMCGRKRLIYLDGLIAYLNAGIPNIDNVIPYSGIAPIK